MENPGGGVAEPAAAQVAILRRRRRQPTQLDRAESFSSALEGMLGFPALEGGGPNNISENAFGSLGFLQSTREWSQHADEDQGQQQCVLQ